MDIVLFCPFGMNPKEKFRYVFNLNPNSIKCLQKFRCSIESKAHSHTHLVTSTSIEEDHLVQLAGDVVERGQSGHHHGHGGHCGGGGHGRGLQLSGEAGRVTTLLLLLSMCVVLVDSGGGLALHLVAVLQLLLQTRKQRRHSTLATRAKCSSSLEQLRHTNLATTGGDNLAVKITETAGGHAGAVSVGNGRRS